MVVAASEPAVSRDRAAEMRRLGDRAREMRLAAGQTQQDVADELGVTRAPVNRFEGGLNDLGASRWRRWLRWSVLFPAGCGTEVLC
jgi:DNA-binding XRE family transcriptional regulator